MPTVLLAQGGEAAEQAESAWETVRVFVYEQGFDFAINVLAAIAILIIGRIIARIVRRFLNNVMGRAKLDDTLRKFLLNLAYAALLTFVIVAALEQLGINTTSFAAILAAAGLAIGLSLQGSLSNFASGVLLIIFKPFEVGHFVEAGGTSGIVEQINIFNTNLRTGDNIAVVVPNGQITSDTIRNFSAKDTRRIDLVVGCGYQDDLREVKQFLENTVADDDRVRADPEPVVAVNELGDNSVNFVVRPWVNTADYWAVRWDLTERIKLGFDERGYSIPYPSRDVYVHQEAS